MALRLLHSTENSLKINLIKKSKYSTQKDNMSQGLEAFSTLKYKRRDFLIPSKKIKQAQTTLLKKLNKKKLNDLKILNLRTTILRSAGK